MKRFLLSLSIVMLAATAVVIAPSYAEAKSCRTFEPRHAPEGTPDEEVLLQAPVHVVSDEHTEADPLVVTYEHGIGAGIPLTREGVLDHQYFNFQVRSRSKAPGLHIKAEWAATSPADIDLYLYDDDGSQIAWAEAWNLPVVDDVSDRVFYEGHGGLGYEYLEGVRASRCSGYSMWSRTNRSLGTQVTLKVWIGSQDAHYDECCP